MKLISKIYLLVISTVIFVAEICLVPKVYALQIKVFEIPTQIISKEKYISAINNYLVELQLARTVPFIDNNTGEILGYKLLDIRKESSLNVLGLRNGDVIKHVNFHKLNSASRSLDLFLDLKENIIESEKLVVGLLRKNMEMNLNFKLVSEVKK